MFDISVRQQIAYSDEFKFVSHDHTKPEDFSEGVYPEMGPEYFAERSNQIIDMLIAEMGEDNFRSIISGTKIQRDWLKNLGAGSSIEVTVYSKWVDVVMQYQGRLHTLCNIRWDDKDLEKAMLELRGEAGILNSWMKRIDGLVDIVT